MEQMKRFNGRNSDRMSPGQKVNSYPPEPWKIYLIWFNSSHQKYEHFNKMNEITR